MGRELHTTDNNVGQPADIILQDGTLAVGQQYVEVVDKPIETDYQKELAFFNDDVEIVVHESTDPNAENPINVGNGGMFVQFFRGEPKKVKRKFVDSLIVKISGVQTPEYINNAGERAFRIVQRSAMKFPFSIINDPSPKGREWLSRRMAEVI